MGEEKKESIFSKMKNAAKTVTEKATVAVKGVRNSLAEKKKAEDYEKYAPLFAENAEDIELIENARVIRIVEYDSRLENHVCAGSIGFVCKTNDRIIPTLYKKYIEQFHFEFYPKFCESVFVTDPCIKGKFIQIEEYFNYMKQVRVNELTLLAQSLGARRVTIRLVAFNSLACNEKSETSVGLHGVTAKKEKQRSEMEQNSIEIWADTTFESNGQDTEISLPDLLYFKNENDIDSLLKMVSSKKSKLTERVYSMSASSSSGMTYGEALSISGLLKKIKFNATGKFEKSAERESKSLLEYKITF